MHNIFEKKLLMLRPQEIVLPRTRTRKSLDEYELQHLANSIRSNGIIQPLSVRKNDSGKYELIAGERRLKAALMAGQRRIPCVLHNTDRKTAELFSVIENLQREELPYFETAESMDRLIVEYGMSQAELSVRLGLAQVCISNKLKILTLEPELRKRVSIAHLSEMHCRAILRLPYEARNTALDEIISKGLSVKQTEDYVERCILGAVEEQEKKLEAEPPSVERVSRKIAIGDMRLFSNSLAKLINTLKSAGINASSKKYETERYVEYRVRIIKEAPLPEGTATQLKIC